MATLPYAAPTTHHKAPALIRPTKRTLLLLILTTATFYWLQARHDPWRLTATLRTSERFWGTTLTDRYIVACPTDEPFQTWDTRTGQLLHSSDRSPLKPKSFDRVVCAGRYILRTNTSSGDLLLIDPTTGALLKKGSLASFGEIEDVRPDLTAVYAKRISNGGPVSYETGLFYPFEPDKPSKPFEAFYCEGDTYLAARFSRDGKTIIYRIPEGHVTPMRFYWHVTFADVATGRRILNLEYNCKLPITPVSAEGACLFAIVEFSRTSSGPSPFSLNRYDATTGKCLSSTLLPDLPAQCDITDDGRTAFSISFGRAPRLGSFDLQSQQCLWKLTVSNIHTLCAFPDNNRVLAPAQDFPTLAIYRRDSPKPLAYLPNPLPSISQAKISPNAQTIALLSNNNSTIHLYHPTGPDCPESTLGLFAFPHTALLLILLIATALSLRADAARHAPPHAHHLLSLLLLLATLPRTYHFLLAAALGHLLLTPAPFLFLAAIALRTGATLWRWTTFTLLALQLPLNLLCLHFLQAQGPRASTPIPLDRTWPIPNLPLLIALALLTLAILPALYHLARPRQPALLL